VISRLELKTEPSSGSGVTGQLLRRIQIGDILHVVRAHVALEAHRTSETATEEPSAQRVGPGALSEELLRAVAVSYLAETAPGRPTGAVKRMAKEFGRPDETVRSWIARARKSGWLGPSVRGRAGAEPGPRLRDLTPDEFGRIFADAYDTPPENPADLAEGFKSMPQERARAASVAWWTRERQNEYARETLEWELKQQGTPESEPGGEEE
jgi:hypothetical protein